MAIRWNLRKVVEAIAGQYGNERAPDARAGGMGALLSGSREVHDAFGRLIHAASVAGGRLHRRCGDEQFHRDQTNHERER